MRSEARRSEGPDGSELAGADPQPPRWRSTYYVQPCPACGRQLMVRVEHLGRQVCCRHCRRRFKAYDPDAFEAPQGDPAESLLDRANALLAKCEAQNGHS